MSSRSEIDYYTSMSPWAVLPVNVVIYTTRKLSALNHCIKKVRALAHILKCSIWVRMCFHWWKHYKKLLRRVHSLTEALVLPSWITVASKTAKEIMRSAWMRAEISRIKAARKSSKTLRSQNLCSLLSLAGCHNQDIGNDLHRLIQSPRHGVKHRIQPQPAALLYIYWKKVTHVRPGSPMHPPIFHTYYKQHVPPHTATPHLPWTHYYAIISVDDSYRSDQSSKWWDFKSGDRDPWRLMFRQHTTELFAARQSEVEAI